MLYSHQQAWEAREQFHCTAMNRPGKPGSNSSAWLSQQSEGLEPSSVKSFWEYTRKALGV